MLIAIVAVFIAYNANSGLPFVPTYDLKAELPSGAKLVKGNEVRVGGFRVGVVDDITPDGRRPERRAARRSRCVDLKLDKTVEPLGVRHEAARPAALGARPQVRRAQARQEQARPSRRATRSR